MKLSIVTSPAMRRVLLLLCLAMPLLYFGANAKAVESNVTEANIKSTLGELVGAFEEYFYLYGAYPFEDGSEKITLSWKDGDDVMPFLLSRLSKLGLLKISNKRDKGKALKRVKYTLKANYALFDVDYELCGSHGSVPFFKEKFCVEFKREFQSDHYPVVVKLVKPNLKLAVYNILHGGHPKAQSKISSIEEQVQLLRNYSPDIVFLNEVDQFTPRSIKRDGKANADNARYFADRLNMDLFFAPEWPYGNGFVGEAILSRIEMRKKDILKISRNSVSTVKDVSIVIGLIDADGEPVNDVDDILLVNAHLAPISYNGNPIWQLSQIMAHLSSEYPHTPIVFGGDLNLHFASLVDSKAAPVNYGFIDSYKECGGKYRSTFRRLVPARIDYIFLKDLNCVLGSSRILLSSAIQK